MLYWRLGFERIFKSIIIFRPLAQSSCKLKYNLFRLLTLVYIHSKTKSRRWVVRRLKAREKFAFRPYCEGVQPVSRSVLCASDFPQSPCESDNLGSSSCSSPVFMSRNRKTPCLSVGLTSTCTRQLEDRGPRSAAASLSSST